MTEYELNPEQWAALMARLGTAYGAFDNAVGYVGSGYTYSRTFIVSGQDEAEVRSRGFSAVANSGEGALASVEVRYARGSQAPTSFAVTTSDPRIQQEIQNLGVAQRGESHMAELMRMYSQALGGMGTPQDRADLMERATLLFRSSAPQQNTRTQVAAPNAGRDGILGDVERALRGTPFSILSPFAATWMEESDRRMRQRDTFSAPNPGRVEPNEDQFHFGPRGGTGFIRHIEPGGSSSVWIGDRRVSTDYPISERNEFRRSGDRQAGTLRIYGDMDRPGRFEVITDNPALRAAMERAKVPVVPATTPQPSQPVREQQARQ